MLASRRLSGKLPVRSILPWGWSRFMASGGGLRKTVVHSHHVEDGGKMVDFAGYALPVEYSEAGHRQSLSIRKSTLWTRESASLFDVSHMTSIRWTGKDANEFVERVTTADLIGLRTNFGTLSVIPNEAGGIIDDTMVSKCGAHEGVPEHIYQVINAGCTEKDLKHFRRILSTFTGDVHMEVLRDNRGLFALQGPKASEVLQRLSPSADVAKISFGQSQWLSLDGKKCFVTRCGYTGEDGFEIFVMEEHASAVWRQLRDEPEVRLAGLGARDVLRLEAGLCLYGHDLNETITPPEAGLSWVVGRSRRAAGAQPFLGSEKILAQLADRKLVKKMRAGLLPKKGPRPSEGDEIRNKEGKRVGTVTSANMSPTLRTNVAMGIIDKPFNKRDTELVVVVRGKEFPAVVTRMPFVPTNYYKLA